MALKQPSYGVQTGGAENTNTSLFPSGDQDGALLCPDPLRRSHPDSPDGRDCRRRRVLRLVGNLLGRSITTQRTSNTTGVTARVATSTAIGLSPTTWQLSLSPVKVTVLEPGFRRLTRSTPFGSAGRGAPESLFTSTA